MAASDDTERGRIEGDRAGGQAAHGPRVTAHRSGDKLVLAESGSGDGWLASDVAVTVHR